MQTRAAILGAAALCLFFAGPIRAGNWPQWRGPFLNGSADETNLPDTWSKTANVRWAAPLPGEGHATPIVWDDAVFVSSPDENKSIQLICLDRTTGKQRWQKQVSVGDRSVGRNNMASPSPVTDGQTVWVMSGAGDVAAFDFQGQPLWARNISANHERFAIQFLYGSSPLLFKNRLYIQVLQRADGNGGHLSYLLCLDAKSGRELWRHERRTGAVRESQEAYTTPLAVESGGRAEIIVLGGDYVTAHDAETGAELWRAGGLRSPQNPSSSRIVPSPVAGDGLVFVCGPKRNPLLAFRDGGQGDVTDKNLAWQYAEYPTDCVTPLFYQGKLFEFDGDKQMMVCLDPKTGKESWRQPAGVSETFRASPTGADGKIYCLSERATAVVFSAADGRVLSTIKMEEGMTHATIAAAQHELFVRTAEHLYCIGK
ncbi:MAG TPA: PQQ-binding-like beta-propeller repeat protein [Verrucomicrobiae bacterium]|jgi:outer membrane protein assembly factor BamB|nr:PQQ-binding-like beta-propeller repeat protein [Verrucomicrobiae bacterium]